MTTQSIAQLASTVLYGKRFFPYYTFNIIGGLDEEGKLKFDGFITRFIHFKKLLSIQVRGLFTVLIPLAPLNARIIALVAPQLPSSNLFLTLKLVKKTELMLIQFLSTLLKRLFRLQKMPLLPLLNVIFILVILLKSGKLLHWVCKLNYSPFAEIDSFYSHFYSH